MNNETGVESPESYNDFLSREFSRTDLPLKIRKTELLRNSGLPIPDTEYLERSSISDLVDALTHRFSESEAPLILRVACEPDRMSMPSVRVDSLSDIASACEQMQNILERERAITHIIIQNVTPKDQAKNKISGRIFLGGPRDINETVELYRGAPHTSILNRATSDDPNFVRIVREPGHFARMQPTNTLKTNVDKDTINDVMRLVNEHDEQIRTVEKVIHDSDPHSEAGVTVEFSYRSGKISFIDIDF